MLTGSQGTGREKWSWREESNLQPVVYKTTALPIELRQLVHMGRHHTIRN